MFPIRVFFVVIFNFMMVYPTVSAPLPVYNITITDGKFSPEEIRVPTNQRFKIIIRNTGAGPAEFENLSMRVEKVLGSGIESFVVIHPLRPGKYHFIDEFHTDMSGFDIIAEELINP